MATTKKPTAKQLAARKRFAAMARSGAFKRKAAKAKAKPAAKKKAPAKKAAKRAAPARKAVRARAPARKRNPSPHTRVSSPSAFEVRHATAAGAAGALIASFPKKTDAVSYALAYVKAHRKAVAIHGRK
jgi:hypothetical protein